MNDQLTPNLQNTILALLLFHPEQGKLARQCLPIKCWPGDPPYLLMIKAIYEYIDTYKQVPDMQILTIIEGLATSAEKQELLFGVINSCIDLREDLTNARIEDTMKRLEKFYRSVTFNDKMMKCLELYNTDGVEAAEEEFNKRDTPFALFDSGINLYDWAVDYLQTSDELRDEDKVSLGIPILDKYSIMPQRKQMFLFVGIPGSGKSFFLVHAGHRAILEGKKVLHLCLEMSEAQIGARYAQCHFSLAKFTNRKSQKIKFENGETKVYDTPDRPLLGKEIIAELLPQLEESDQLRKNLKIKEYPELSITVSDLRILLDNIETQENFVPDVLIVDYADLFKIPTESYRLELNNVYRELRGFARERNLILVTATQINREGTKLIKSGKDPDQTVIAESYDKAMIADYSICHAQTELEEDYELARLVVLKGRDAPKVKLYISQSYNIGQFCVSSQEINKEFQPQMKMLQDQMKAEAGT